MIPTDSDRYHFDTYGYLVVRQLYTPKNVGLARSWLQQIRRAPLSPGQYAPYYEESLDGKSTVLSRIENLLWNHDEQANSILVPAHVLTWAHYLLREAPVLFKDKVNFKPPGGRGDKLHQDQAAGWSQYASSFITLCVALDDNTLANGAITVRHKTPRLRELIGPEWQPLSQLDPPYLPDDEWTTLYLAAGDAVFFDSFVPHGSPPNTTTMERRNLFLTWNRKSEGDHRQRYYLDKWRSHPPNQASSPHSPVVHRV